MSGTWDLDAWVRRYRAVRADDPVPATQLDALDRILGFPMPAVFRRVTTVFPGDLLGRMEIFSFDPAGPFPTVASRSNELRAQRLIGDTDVVLAEPSESLVVWRSAPSDGSVIWLSAHDVERVLVRGEPPLTDVDVWSGLGWFLEWCLADEEEDTASID